MKTPEKQVFSSFLWDIPLSESRGDDESSVSSTVSVENPPKAEPLSPSSSSSSLSSSNTSHRVRFDESSNVLYANSLYVQEECAESWYTAEDYHDFKSAVSFMAKMIDRAEGGGLDNELRDPLSYTGILESIYLSCCQVQSWERHDTALSMVQQDHLKHLFALEIGLGRLGLERRSVRTVSKDKSRRRSDLLEIVEQRVAWSEDELRRRCETISLASRLFARFLAQAQSAALNDFVTATTSTLPMHSAACNHF